MSGVLVDLTSRGDFGEMDPDLGPHEAAVVADLVRRNRPLVGGIKIVGPIVGPSDTTAGARLEFSGTLGVLLEDANFPDVAYGVTSRHVLEEGASKAAGLTLQLGHSVFQPTQHYYSGPAAGFTRIGWLIAQYEPLDLALIGICPGLRWKPHIHSLGDTRGGQPFVDSFTPAPLAGSPGPRTIQTWSFDPEPVLGSLPTSGPVVKKVGQRTGFTSGRAYRLIAKTQKYQPVPRSVADGGSATDSAAWNLLKARYLADPELVDSVPESPAIDPVLYLCLPDQVGSSVTMTSFQQTGDSGSALVDEAGVVVGIVSDQVATDAALKNWIAGLALPIDLVIGALQEQIDVVYGKVGAPADWPAPRVPDVPAGSPDAPPRRVPRTPEPRWYQLALPSLKGANP